MTYVGDAGYAQSSAGTSKGTAESRKSEFVVEVAYGHMQSGRFRHMAHFRRWRTDRKPASCTFAQLEVVPPEELKAIFPHGR